MSVMLISESERVAPVDDSDSNIRSRCPSSWTFYQLFKDSLTSSEKRKRGPRMIFCHFRFRAQLVPIGKFSLLGNASAKSKNFRGIAPL